MYCVLYLLIIILYESYSLLPMRELVFFTNESFYSGIYLFSCSIFLTIANYRKLNRKPKNENKCKKIQVGYHIRKLTFITILEILSLN